MLWNVSLHVYGKKRTFFSCKLSKIRKTTSALLLTMLGYCARSLLKRLSQCADCRSYFTTGDTVNEPPNSGSVLISSLSRGGLIFPRENVVHAVTYTYIILNKILNDSSFEAEFLKKIENQKLILSEITLNCLCFDELLNEDQCEMGHSYLKSTKHIVSVTANILLNSYSKRKNDVLPRKSSNRRKLSTLTS